MPRRCSIYGCRSNYDSEGDRTTTFSLPKDAKRRELWLSKIPTDFSKFKKPCVCIKHFHDSCVVTVDRVMYKGEMREFPRIRPKLIEDAVPSIFPQTLSNFSECASKAIPKRECFVDAEEEPLETEDCVPSIFLNTPLNYSETIPEVECLLIGEESPFQTEDSEPPVFANTPSYFTETIFKEEPFQEVIEESVIDYEYIEGGEVNSLNDIVLLLESKQIYSGKWTYIQTDKQLFICFIQIENEIPSLSSYILVHNDLTFDAFVKKLRVTNASLGKMKLNSLNSLENIMSLIENATVLPTVEYKLLPAVKSEPIYG